jgi:peptidoglycan/xylan/chitin deacetylase (PgdA/CDA1 family)
MGLTPRTAPARAKRQIAAVLHRSGMLEAWTRAALKNCAIILTYHQVLQDHEVRSDLPPGMYVTVDTLELHFRYLSKVFRMVTLDELRDWGAGIRTFPKIPCAITFDDGWEDNYRNAFGVLTAHGVPATIFLVTEQIGTRGMMTWNQVLEMEEAGISFGSHTATHPQLPTLPEDKMRWELESSLRTLQRRLKRPSSWFCYPKGLHCPATRRIAQEHYAGAVTASGGVVSRGDDVFLLNRIAMHNDVSYTIPLLASRIARIF